MGIVMKAINKDPSSQHFGVTIDVQGENETLYFYQLSGDSTFYSIKKEHVKFLDQQENKIPNCPYCNSRKYLRERRPNGLTRCQQCGFMCPSNEWDQQNIIDKKEST